MNSSSIFHLAIPITDVEQAKDFYSRALACKIGRESDHAVIFDFYGHQVVAHVTKETLTPQKGIYPRHFGLVLSTKEEWEDLVDRSKNTGLNFYQKPKKRFPGEMTEHWTFFLQDPFYNLLEFKYYSHHEAIFGSQDINKIGDFDPN